ncbi:MAG: energy transducer TonB [Candidatus Omnitrophica bacterium]|nr:energy transducer TonB [Candidatus Omnitrophota bacterium]
MQSNRAISAAFVISLVGHCLFLGMPGINIISRQDKKPEDMVVRIEIEKPPLLPKIDVMGEEKKLKEIVKEEELPEPEPEEQINEVMIEKPEPPKEIIEVINPQEEAMLRYQDMVKQRIEETRRYPLWAKRQGIEGIVYISFTVLSNGSSQDIKIVRSSGSKILDEEAVETIKRANPFPPMPKEISVSFVHMEVSIVFIFQ